MNCSRCRKEITEDQSYVYNGKVMCEDCVMDVGLTLKECDPWATYVDTSARKRHGATGTAELTDSEARTYELIKARGRATRKEVMDSLNLKESDLNAHLQILMHSELVKEMGEGGQRYLVVVPVES
jgi:predicted HTH transcriptional regulator